MAPAIVDRIGHIVFLNPKLNSVFFLQRSSENDLYSTQYNFSYSRLFLYDICCITALNSNESLYWKTGSALLHIQCCIDASRAMEP